MKRSITWMPMVRRGAFPTLFALLLAACASGDVPESGEVDLPPPTLVSGAVEEQPTDAMASLEATAPASEAPAKDAERQSFGAVSLIDPGLGVAFEATTEAEVSGDGGPVWEIQPEHRRIDLQGYPSSNTYHEASLRVYPIEDFVALYPDLAAQVDALEARLDAPASGEEVIPLLPFFNAQQVLRAQVAPLDFESGRGLRFLTQYDQAFMPISNAELFYTFQGLTSDGRWWVSAILPVAHPELETGEALSGDAFEDFAAGFASYLEETRAMLDTEPAERFTPDLSLLDALVASIRVE